MFVSMIIPAYNEQDRIGRTLEAYGDFFKRRKGKNFDFEIIVVANACKDNTAGVVREKAKKYKEIKLLDFEQGGKGFAVKQGFKEALKSKAGLIGFVDADLATPPEAYFDLIKNIGSYEGIIASRYIKGSVLKPKQSFSRIFIGRVFNLIVRSLFLMPYQDTQCGAKLFKRKAIEQALDKLNISQWAIDIDLLYNLRKIGFRVKEYPSTWQDIGGSKLDIKKASAQMFFAVIQLRLLNSMFKKSIKVLKPIIKPVYNLIRN